MSNKPSLHQLAIVLGIPYTRLANAQVAYKPQVGKPYSKDDINWEAVDAFVTRRLDKTDYESLDALYEAALSTEYTPKTRAHNPDSVWGKFLFGTTPVRKGHLAIGDIVKAKKTGVEYKVVFVNDTIVCMDEIVEDGSPVATSSVGNRVFNNQYEIVSSDEVDEVAVGQ